MKITNFRISIFLPLFTLIAVFAGISCNSAREAAGEEPTTPAQKPEPCEYEGVVKDMRGLDGCEFFIVSEGGMQLAPTNWDKFDWEPADGQKVTFEYVVMKEMMSVCMAEDAIVRLTCLQSVK